MVVRTGPQEYEIYDGTLTSCQLPNPDWMLSSGKFTVDMDSKKATGAEQHVPADEYPAAVSAVCDASGGLGRTAERLSDSYAGLLFDEGNHPW